MRGVCGLSPSAPAPASRPRTARSRRTDRSRSLGGGWRSHGSGKDTSMAKIARREPTTRTAGRGEGREFPAGQNAPGQLARFRTVVGQILYAPDQPADRLFYLQSGAGRDLSDQSIGPEVDRPRSTTPGSSSRRSRRSRTARTPASRKPRPLARSTRSPRRICPNCSLAFLRWRGGSSPSWPRVCATAKPRSWDRPTTGSKHGWPAHYSGSPARLGGANLALGQKNLAERVGASRESVTRTLSSLAAKGLVERSRRRITILDEAKLRELADGTCG